MVIVREGIGMTGLTLAFVGLSMALFAHAAQQLAHGADRAFPARYWGLWPLIMSLAFAGYVRMYAPFGITSPGATAFICFGGAVLGAWFLSWMRRRGSRAVS